MLHFSASITAFSSVDLSAANPVMVSGPPGENGWHLSKDRGGKKQSPAMVCRPAAVLAKPLAAAAAAAPFFSVGHSLRAAGGILLFAVGAVSSLQPRGSFDGSRSAAAFWSRAAAAGRHAPLFFSRLPTLRGLPSKNSL